MRQAAEESTKLQVEGGTLQDRLKLLEEQKKRDGAKLHHHKTAADAGQVSDDLIRERLQWIEKQKDLQAASTPEKEAIAVEGGGLKDRLKLLEEQKKRDDAKLASHKTAADRGQVSENLIRQRLQWMENQSKQHILQKEAIIIEGGGVKDRLKLLEYQRQQEALRLVSKATGLAEISDDLIQERLKWMDEQAKQLAEAPGNSKAAIIVEGGNLQERLELLEEQRRRAKEKSKPDFSEVSDDLIRERLAWMDEQTKLQEEAAGADKEAIVIEGGNLAERKWLLEEQRRREAERLAVRRLAVEVSPDTLEDRMEWLQQQTQADSREKNGQYELISNSLVTQRMAWLRENAEKATQLPEKESIEVTNSLVKQRKAWLDEQMQKARELPRRERIEVTHGLISERMAWLSAAMSRADTMSRKERTQMTSDLISERLAYLEAQIQANADAEAKASLEMQIIFLEEQQQVAEQMTEDEQLVMTNVLINEKMQDLEQQKGLITEISEDQQIEVTQALLEDRQAWLEGDQDHYARKREEQKRAQEEAEARALEEQATISRIAEEVANSVAFWTEQKESAAEMSPPERAQITVFLIAEHIVSLEVQLEDESIDEETKESVEQQIAFLNDQMDNIDDIDHLMMIDVLVQEKVSNLERMLQ